MGGARESGPSAIFQLFCAAILAEKQVVCRYKGHSREVCPYILGHSAGEEKALVFQFAGTSSSALPLGGEWRCLFLKDVRHAAMRNGPWHGKTQHRTTQSCVEEVYLDVNIATPNQSGRR